MSRQIELDKPLSSEDRQYLMDRDRFSEIAQNDAKFGGADAPAEVAVDQFGRPIGEGQTGDVGFNREMTGHVVGARNLTPPPVAPSIAGAGNAGLGEAAEPDPEPDDVDDEDVNVRGQLTVGGGDPSQGGQAFSAVEDDDDDDEDSEGDEYSSMTNAALRKALKSRGLPSTGKGAEMRSRLRDDDAAQAEQD